MALELLLGVNNSGKTKYIFDNIKEDIENKRKCLVIVPSQMRLIYEQRYLNETNENGLLDLDVTSFSRLIEKNINTKSLDEEDVLSKTDKTILFRKIVRKNPEVFRLFEKSKNKEGFWASIDIIIELIKKEGKTPKDLENVDIKNGRLKQKLEDIAKIYDIFSEELKANYIDSIDEALMFQNMIKDIDAFKDANIYIDGYNNFSKSELAIIYELEKVANSVNVSLVTDVKNSEEALANLDQDIYLTANETYAIISEKCAKLGVTLKTKKFERYKENRSPELSYINENLFKIIPEKKEIQSDNIEIHLTKNPYTEVEEISKIIAKYVREGYRYNDFAIFTGDLEAYKVPVKKVFYDFDIPYYIDVKEKILTNSLVMYISSMLNIIRKNYDTESILKLLKTGLTDISYEDICYIENYTLEYNINYYKKWNTPFIVYEKQAEYEVLKYEEERLNNIRERIIEIIRDFSSAFDRKNKVENLAEKIYNHISTGAVFEKYNEQIRNLTDNNMKYYANIYTQVINKIIDILDSMVKIYKNEVLTFEEFSSNFDYCIKDIEITPLSNNIDEIIVAEIGSSRILNKKIVFILGANEDKMPKGAKEDVIFSDRELEELKESGLEFRKPSYVKNFMEEYNINLAFEKATEKLYIYFSSSRLNGSSLIKSSIVKKVEDLLNKKAIGNVTITDEVDIKDAIYSKKVFSKKCIKAIYKLAKTGEMEEYKDFARIYKEYKTDKLKEILNYVRTDKDLSKETTDLIYKDSLHSTVSRLETFKKCSFKYFMQYTLKAEERKEFKITTADEGTFMHNVIEKFAEYIQDYRDGMWHATLKDNEYEKVVDGIVDTMIDNNTKRFGESKKYIALKNLLTHRIKKIVQMIAESFNQSMFEQLGQEIEFKEGNKFTPIEIKLEDGRRMLITGKIDRVDTYVTENATYTRIIDYKSSKKELTLDDVREGISLQLMTYMYALVKSGDSLFKGKPIIPAGTLYFTLATPKLKDTKYIDDEEKIKAEIIKMFKLDGIFISDVEILKQMDKKFNEKDSRIAVDQKRISNNKNVLSQDDFIKECNNIQNILASIGNEIVEGKVAINPINNKKIKTCKYCQYNEICRKKVTT